MNGYRLPRLVRRHLAGVQRVEDFLPALGILHRAEIKRDVIPPQLPLLLLRAVAGKAVVFEKRAVFFIELHA